MPFRESFFTDIHFAQLRVCLSLSDTFKLFADLKKLGYIQPRVKFICHPAGKQGGDARSPVYWTPRYLPGFAWWQRI